MRVPVLYTGTGIVTKANLVEPAQFKNFLSLKVRLYGETARDFISEAETMIRFVQASRDIDPRRKVVTPYVLREDCVDVLFRTYRTESYYKKTDAFGNRIEPEDIVTYQSVKIGYIVLITKAVDKDLSFVTLGLKSVQLVDSGVFGLV